MQGRPTYSKPGNWLHLARACRSAVSSRDGSIAAWFGISLPILIMIVGMTIEFARFSNLKMQLNAATDAAALASAKEMSLTDTQTYDLSAVAKAVVDTQLAAQTSAWNLPPVSVETDVATSLLQVAVTANHSFVPVFGAVAGFLPTEVKSRSVARVVGKPNICVLALEPTELGAIFLAKSARMTGDRCSVFSNSTSVDGMVVRDNARLEAKSICSAGGVDGGGSITPQAYTDCPHFTDPLAGRAAPTVGSCTFNNMSIKDQTVHLTPGVYCGGLKIDGASTVTFEPGDYVIDKGQFLVSGSSKIQGDGVSFYLGDAVSLFFGPESSIDLAATRKGVMAGLLVFGSRNQSKLLTHTILSKNAQKLVGTIYLPRNSFIVDGEASVGSSSAYTAIVARRVVLMSGPHLVLNSNYDQTDVPVPEGIRGATQPAKLVE